MRGEEGRRGGRCCDPRLPPPPSLFPPCLQEAEGVVDDMSIIVAEIGTMLLPAPPPPAAS